MNKKDRGYGTVFFGLSQGSIRARTFKFPIFATNILAMKKLEIGVDDFKKLRESDAYFVDKSLFIEEIIEDRSEVFLLPRPRRFGKTLNMSMLNYFFYQ